MSKLLIVDFLYVEAHRVMNINLIQCFAENNQVTVLDLNGYYKEQKKCWEEKNIKVVSYKVNQIGEGKIKSRFNSLRMMQAARVQCQNHDYDLMIVLAYDTMSFAIGRVGFGRVPVAVYHHKNIDELTNRWKLKLFNTYKNKIYHLVFEDYFQNYLIEKIGVEKRDRKSVV